MHAFVRAAPLVRSLLVLLLSLAAQRALAFDSEAGNPILDRFNIDVGTLFYGSGTSVTLNGAAGQVGVPIDLEHELGFKEATRFRVDGYWRFTAHQRLRFAYFEADRHTSKTINENLHYGNVTFPVGATVDAHNNVSIAELIYEYDFFVRENFSLGANFGIHNLDFGLGLAANTVTPTSGKTAVSLYQNASADGPLPMIGLAAIWRWSPWFYVTAGVQGLKVTVNPYSGTLYDGAATFVWQPTKHFGVGGGYDYFHIDASVNKTDFNGSLTWRYSGPRVFLAASF
jgi:hypothetical protein